MKKTLLFVLMALCSHALLAGNGKGPAAVSIIENGGSAYLYKINTESWPGHSFTDGWNDNTAFAGKDFGTPTSLVLDGGAVVAWASDGDYYASDSWVVKYRVYRTTDTAPEEWNSLDISFLVGNSGNDFKYDTSGRNIDILALATSGAGTYNFDVQLNMKGYWSGGSWPETLPTQTATFTVAAAIDEVVAEFNYGENATYGIGLTGVECNFTNASQHATSYVWKINDTQVATTSNLAYTFTTAGTYNVELTASADDTPDNVIVKTMRIFEKSTTTNLIVDGAMTTVDSWGFATLGNTQQPTITWNSSNAPTGATTALHFAKNNNEDRFAIYQPVYLTAAGTYQFDCLVGSINMAASEPNCNLQLYIGTVIPTNTADLVEETKITEISTWNSPSNFIAGSYRTNSGNNCQYTAETSGIYYVCLRFTSWYSQGFEASISNLSLTNTADISTGIAEQQTIMPEITIQNGLLQINFEGTADIVLYNVNGQLIDKQIANGVYTNNLSTGMYFVRINGNAHKIIVR